MFFFLLHRYYSYSIFIIEKFIFDRVKCKSCRVFTAKLPMVNRITLASSLSALLIRIIIVSEITHTLYSGLILTILDFSLVHFSRLCSILVPFSRIYDRMFAMPIFFSIILLKVQVVDIYTIEQVII